MANEVSLSNVLSDFARTMLTDFPIQKILDHLVTQIVAVLPISAAGVTLISAGEAPRYIAASDADALRFEQLQSEIGEGPCLEAFQSGHAVACADLKSEQQRFPRFAEAAVHAGLSAVFTFPLRHGADVRLGALDLYRTTPGDLADEDMAAAQTLADVTSAYLLNAQAREATVDSARRFQRSSLHDALTGLPNRSLFQEHLDEAAQRPDHAPGRAAVLYLDLDGFKDVNDTYGHQVGDELLIGVAERLSGVVRAGDTLARFSGDEFVFLCPDIAGQDDVAGLAARIGHALTAPFMLDGNEVCISASVGIAVAGPGARVSRDLVDEADTAMYQIKRKGGGGYQLFDLRAAQDSNEANRLERELHSALAHDQLYLVYQPIVQSMNGRVLGVEALLRWTHPTRGPIPAPTMIGLAERSGLIVDLGAWVLHRACEDRQAWLRAHPDRPLDLSVNVSARQFMSADFAACVEQLTEDTEMDPAALILEMTESIFVEDTARVTTALRSVAALGVRLALDDFGTGYSSLAYLGRLPIAILKIDKSFVIGLEHDITRQTIVASVTDLAHALGLVVIAEGVETAEQQACVVKLGCENAQGYHFARPMQAADIGALLATAHAGGFQPLSR